MTIQECINYYVNLLILQYHTKPKARATIEALIKNIIMDKILLKVQNGFDIKTSVGNQLDILGKYIGVKRILADESNLGDAEYRTLLLFSISKNYTVSTLFDIKRILFSSFQNKIKIFDKGNMTVSYFIDSSIGSASFLKSLILNNLLPKPMAIENGSFITSDNINNFFSFRKYGRENININGFNTYASYSQDKTWLSYSDSII